MNSLGIKVTTTKVFYAIYNSKNRTIITEKFALSESLDLPHNFKNIREYFLKIIQEEKIDIAGIKTADNNGLSISIPRIGIEGVIQEAFASSEIPSYSLFSLKEISQSLTVKTREYKPLTTNAELFFSFIESYIEDKTFKTNNESREAILVALATINQTNK